MLRHLPRRLPPPRTQHVHKAIGGDDAAAEAAMGRDIDGALERLAGSAMEANAQAALGRGDARAFEGVLDWETFSYALPDALTDPLGGVFLSKGLRSMFDLSPVTAMLDFELLEPRAIQWATQQAGARVVQVTAEIRGQVRQLVAESLGGKVGDVPALARRIRDLIPLHSRYVRAADATYNRVFADRVAAGATPDAALAAATEARVKHAAKLRKARSLNIARTEVMTASNAGRYEGWAVQIGTGKVDTQSRKEWTVGANACPICDPMNGEVVLWTDTFSGGHVMPPQHPSCRCTGVLLPPDTPLRGPQGIDRTGAQEPGAPTPPRSGRKPASAPDTGPNPGTKLNATNITNEQGQSIAASARAVTRGEYTMAEHRQYVRDLTNTDSKGRVRSTPAPRNVQPPSKARTP